MIKEIIYSPLGGKEINKELEKDLNNSTIWSMAYKKEELTEEVINKYNIWYIYTIKFDGLKPIQVINTVTKRVIKGALV